MTQERATSVDAGGADSDRFLRLIGGRRSYNRRRMIMAEQRRMRVARLLRDVDLRKRGWQSAIAKEIGCHRGTICRDISAIGAMIRRQREAAAAADLQRRRSFLFQLERCLDPAFFRDPT